MFLKRPIFVAALIASVFSAAHAEDYYKPDPAKLAQLEAQRCSRLYNEGHVIRTRLAGGNNHDYDIVKMKTRLTEIDSDYGKYCLNWQPPVTPVPTAKPKSKR